MRQLALWISWLLLFVVPFEYMYASGTLGSVVRVVGIALAGMWLLSTLIRGRFRRLHGLHLPMIAFVLWGGASIFWSVSPEESKEQVKTYVQLVLLAVIVWDLYDREEHLYLGLQAYVLGLWTSVGTLLHSFFIGDVQRRFSIGLFNENTLGFILALGIPIAWFLAMGARNRTHDLGGPIAPLLRLSNLLFIPAGLFCISLTASRASMASAVIALVYMALSLRGLRGGSRILILAGGAAAAVYAVSLIPRESVDRLESTTVEVSDGDWNGRLPIWREASGLIADRPLLGVGLNAFHRAAVRTNKTAHSVPISLLAELGVIGFGLFGLLLLGWGVVALRLPAPVAFFWLTVLAIWSLSSLMHDFADKKITWLLLGMVAATDGLLRTEEHRPPAAARTPLPDAAPAR